MLRSKSLDRNSYNSGDWFNRLDFTYQSNNWGVGLPLEEVNGSNWPIMEPLLGTLPAPGEEDILANVTHYREMLAIAQSSPLFRLETEADVQERLAFQNIGPTQVPGLIVMTLSDQTATDLDAEYEYIIVLFNATDEEQSYELSSLAERSIVLHPVQATSSDPVVQTSSYDLSTGTFTVPARTTAVFVEQENPTALTVSGVDSPAPGGLALPLALLGGTLVTGLALAAWRRRRA